jgi:hypothetical protein
MEVNTTIICKQINKYLSNELPKEDFSKWAYDAMYSLLKGDILKIKNIAIWKFITVLTQVDDACQACTDNDIRQIERIINGDENAVFLFHMKVPKESQDVMMVRIYDLLKKHKNGEVMNSQEINEIESYANYALFETVTIVDLFIIQISKLLSSAYSFYAHDNHMVFDLDSIIFLNENDVFESEYLLKILYLLECGIGNRYFSVCVKYSNGISTVSIT